MPIESARRCSMILIASSWPAVLDRNRSAIPARHCTRHARQSGHSCMQFVQDALVGVVVVVVEVGEDQS